MKLFESMHRSWTISYEGDVLQIIHTRQTSEIDWIEIDLLSGVTTASLSGQKFHMVAKIENETQAKMAITEILEKAIAYHASVNKRIKKAIEDIGE